MFLIYLDESGKPHKTDLSENFTIAGVIVNESSWNEIEDKINELKKSIFGNQWQLYELHMSEILHGNKIYSKFKLDERLKILEKVFDTIKNLNIRVVGSVIKKEKMNDKIDIEMWALRLLFERICWNLKDLNNSLKTAGQKEQ